MEGMLSIPAFRPPPEHSIRKIDRVVGNSQVQSYLSTPQLNVSTDEGNNTVSRQCPLKQLSRTNQQRDNPRCYREPSTISLFDTAPGLSYSIVWW